MSICICKLSKAIPAIKDDLPFLNIITGGYKNGKPVVCFADLKNDIAMYAQDSGLLLQDKKINFGEGTKYDAKYCLRNSCTIVAGVIEKSILDYAIKEKHTDEIGGKIMVVKITRKNIGWMKNKPSKPRWVTVTDFLNDYKKGKVKIRFLTNDAEEFIKKYKPK